MLYTNCSLLPDFIGVLLQAQQGLILVKEGGCNIPITKYSSPSILRNTASGKLIESVLVFPLRPQTM